jgi:hypothetical protein
MRESMKLVTAVCLLLVCGAASATAVEISGVIGSDTTWTNAEPITVVGDVTVAATGHLTIATGTFVRFQNPTGLDVEGQLTVNGTHWQPVTFTSSADTLGGAPAGGDWAGIEFMTGADGLLRHCRIQYAVNPVFITEASPTLDSCALIDFTGFGLYIDGNASDPPISPSIQYCAIEQRGGVDIGTATGIYVRENAHPVIHGCAVRWCNTGIDYYTQDASRPQIDISDCDISGNFVQALFTHGG